MTEKEMATLLGAERDHFLRFLRNRLGTSDLAEDVLHGAYIKALQSADGIREDENTVAWFWRVLRNSVIDTYRQRGAEVRALDQMQRWGEADEPLEPELRDAVCRCLGGVLETLKPEYASLVRQIDLEGLEVPEAAFAAGITPNNAAVRLHRARAALRQRLQQTCGACAEHGCLDCGCKRPRV
jgi:RNA polymerase sigma-70 factor (ECF subfamily)